MKCKYREINQKEQKCSDYYLKGNEQICMCKLKEWKKKLKVCPYDSTIKSCSRKKPFQKELILK